ncbi:hypothetical protein BCR41DRAFT_368781 [Lobosporangium transversale]|uniref:Uncharacterized protein n=1 Tax=Lobosporangium transversale TaxID=64571 RepID=A0A1Y2GV98_9FUNG|nr:hypothetical protein BCR41DRAFT_368781 [Lobosporangium transversale]ORZ24979.1 hypothetical protein BCR41DRAFT_368781 [Lobosporangium transversale]|eukprot:XP_021883960.1 hypothetical protein BCR41DRAFT_368781 [Lobosporangium transversale]
MTLPLYFQQHYLYSHQRLHVQSLVLCILTFLMFVRLGPTASPIYPSNLVTRRELHRGSSHYNDRTVVICVSINMWEKRGKGREEEKYKCSVHGNMDLKAQISLQLALNLALTLEDRIKLEASKQERISNMNTPLYINSHAKLTWSKLNSRTVQGQYDWYCTARVATYFHFKIAYE